MSERPSTAAQLVASRADDHGVGVWFEGRTWRWADAVDEAAARADWLLAHRVEGPFHVGVLLDNTPEYLFQLMGAALAGAVVVGINPTRRGAELARDIVHTNCQLIVTEASQATLLEGLDLGMPAERIVITDTAEGAESFHLTAHRRQAMPEPSAEDLFLLLFTSGSTGAPKAVRLTQGRAARAAARVPFGADDVLYSAMPLFHGNALNSMVFPAWASGATVALRRRFSASSFVDDLRATHATFFSTVGRAISHILATPTRPDDRDHQVRYGLAPETPRPDISAFKERFGITLFEGYGSSENAIVLQPAPRGAAAGALGVAAAGDDIAVVDPATGEECPVARFDDAGRLVNPDEAIGELVGRNTGGRFEGYWNHPEADAERTRGGWYWSGDLAYRDEARVFYFAGRSGEWLRVDSENFAAAPVERVLARFAAAAGAAVYPVPDPSTGDQVMVTYELVPGARFDPAEYVAFLEAQADLGTKWAPRFVRITDALPLGGTHKVNKAPLRAAAWRTTDPVWHRPGRELRYERIDEAAVAALADAFESNGRTHLLDAATAPGQGGALSEGATGPASTRSTT